MKNSIKLFVSLAVIMFLFNNCKSETSKNEISKNGINGYELSSYDLASYEVSKNEANKIENVQSKIKDLYVKNKNIYIQFTDGAKKQITFNGSDDVPLFYNDQEDIIFIRTVKESGMNSNYERKKLMIVSIYDLTERTITEKKPYKDGNDQSHEIFNIGNLTISKDKKSIYFTTEKWVTSDQLVKVNIKNGKWQELFAANNFDYISKGKYSGQFLIAKSEIRDKGRATYYMLVDEEGIVKKEFENEKSAEAFLKVK